MIVPQHLCVPDMEVGNRLNLIKEEGLEVGNTIAKLNGSNNGSLV